MCGICGITKEDKKSISVLTDALKHRGPDDVGVFCAPGISLGHRRLAIIDLSERANQPIHSADGRYVIIYNGELYNYQELKSELASKYTFETTGDTEVVLYAYLEWGVGMLKRLNGIFACAIWDSKDSELFVCRDQMGVKPLYYTVHNGELAFSSELSGLRSITSGVINKKSAALYFGLNYVPPGESMLVDIQKLPAGHYLIHKNKKVTLHEYFDVFLGDGVSPNYKSLYETIDCAVKRQLVSDRPVGIFLSGGIDSSAVLHHASQYMDDVKTYSVSFEMTKDALDQAERFNEDSVLAERTAVHYGTEHKTFPITIEHVRDSLEKALQSLDEPVANPTAISQYLLSKWVREDGIVVALGGDGGDELFGGYTRHRAMMAAHYYGYVPSFIQNVLNSVHPRFKKLGCAPGLPLHAALMANKEDLIERITKNSLNAHSTVEKMLQKYYDRAPKGLHELDQFMRVDRRTWLAEESLARSDRSSMAHGLELRVPLLDVDVVRFADSLNVFLKTTPLTGKRIMRSTYKHHLPSYLHNQPKRGWISPGAKWFRDPVINIFVQEAFSPGYYNGLDDLINWDEVQKMLKEHVEGNGYYLQPLWNVLVLQVWARAHTVRFS